MKKLLILLLIQFVYLNACYNNDFQEIFSSNIEESLIASIENYINHDLQLNPNIVNNKPICPICFREFTKFDYIKLHCISIHLKCLKCNTIFNTKKEAKDHYKDQHKKKFSAGFKCEFCPNKIIRYYTAYLKHIITQHLCCTICNLNFKDKKEALEHFNIHRSNYI